jgi:hypothetical protein
MNVYLEQLPVKEEMCYKGKSYLIEVRLPAEHIASLHGHVIVDITKLFKPTGRWVTTAQTVIIPKTAFLRGLNVSQLIDGF